jgi:hypothetical protein
MWRQKFWYILLHIDFQVVNTNFRIFLSNCKKIFGNILPIVCTHIYRVTFYMYAETHVDIIVIFPSLFTNLTNWNLSTNVLKVTSRIFLRKFIWRFPSCYMRRGETDGHDKRRGGGNAFLIFLLKHAKHYTCRNVHMLPLVIYENRPKVSVELVTMLVLWN